MPFEKQLSSHEKEGFGSAAKRPKLSNNISSSLTVKATAYDDLWGDDLPEDELEECFQLATQHTQIKIQESFNGEGTSSLQGVKQSYNSKVTPSTSTSHQSYYERKRISSHMPQLARNTARPTTFVKVSQQTVPSSIFEVQEPEPSLVSNTKLGPKEFTCVKKIPKVIGSGPSHYQYLGNINHSRNNVKMMPPATSHGNTFNQKEETLLEQINQLKKENESLKEKSVTKDGEVIMLRQELKKCEVKAKNQLHSTEEEYKCKIRNLEKEVDRAKTATELQRLETWKASDKLLMEINTPVEPVSSASESCDEFEGAEEAVTINCDGEILFRTISPYLLEKSRYEYHKLKLESCAGFQHDILDRNAPSVYPDHDTIESCWNTTVQLSLEKSFDTFRAQTYIKTLFLECQKILCSLLITLRLKDEKEANHILNLQRDVSNIDAQDDPSLLSYQLWYENEKGVESRSIIGLVATISLFSKYMADLVSGLHEEKFEKLLSQKTHSDSITNHREVLPISPAVPEKPAVDAMNEVNIAIEVDPTEPELCKSEAQSSEQASTDNGLGKDNICHVPSNEYNRLHAFPGKVNGSQQCIRPTKQQSETPREGSNVLLDLVTYYSNQQFGFLKLLLDIAEEISGQNISPEYSGYLTAVIVLLANTKRKGTPVSELDKCNIIVDIVKIIIFSQPRMETSAAIIELFQESSFNIEFLESFCHCTQLKPDWEVKNRLGQFGKDCCALRVLCWQLERQTNSVRLRTKVSGSIVNLMTALVKLRPCGGPKWTRLQEPSQVDNCFCRTRMVETSITRIYQTFQDFENIAHLKRHLKDSTHLTQRKALRDVLAKGTMLLYFQLDSDPGFVFYMEEVEGYYQLLLMSLKSTDHNLEFLEHERNALRDLLAMEESITPQKFDLKDNLKQYFEHFFEKLKFTDSE